MKKNNEYFKLKILDILSSMKIKAIITEYSNKSRFKKQDEITSSNINKPTKILPVSKTKFSINSMIVFNKFININII